MEQNTSEDVIIIHLHQMRQSKDVNLLQSISRTTSQNALRLCEEHVNTSEDVD